MTSIAAKPEPPAVLMLERATLQDIVVDLQRLESFHALMAANDCAGFFGMSRAQKSDLLCLSSELSLDVRCRLAALLK